MSSEKRLCYIILSLCVVGISFIFIFTAILDHNQANASNEEIKVAEEIKYIYVYVEKAPSASDLNQEATAEKTSKWIVKDYYGRIGIFTPDGEIYQILDTYTKSLPQADQDLLKEGFVVNSQSELYSIIEDYTG